jgi:hypothetical protein
VALERVEHLGNQAGADCTSGGKPGSILVMGGAFGKPIWSRHASGGNQDFLLEWVEPLVNRAEKNYASGRNQDRPMEWVEHLGNQAGADYASGGNNDQSLDRVKHGRRAVADYAS